MVSFQETIALLITAFAAAYSVRFMYKSLTRGEAPAHCAKCALMQKNR